MGVHPTNRTHLTKHTIAPIHRKFFLSVRVYISVISQRALLAYSSLWVLRKTPKVTYFYDIGNTLGNPGQFGVVKEAKEISSGRLFAVKVVSKHKFKDRKLTANFFADLRAETHLQMVSTDHPFIIDMVISPFIDNSFFGSSVLIYIR